MSLRPLVVGLALLALVLVAWSSPRWLPYNMDEFVHYQPLGCATAPLSESLGAFRESCHLYGLRLPFTPTALPLRSYLYIGSVPAVVFYPFWKVLGDPVAARVQGAFFLALATALAARYLRVRLRSVALAGLVLPFFAVSFLADEGPVGLSILLLLSALLLLRRLATASTARERAIAAIGAGLAVFLGIWVKLTFVFWLPALAVLAGREWRAGVVPPKRLMPALLTAAVTAGVPTLWLLAAVDGEGRPYYAAVSRAQLSADPLDAAVTASRLAGYLWDTSRAAARTLELPFSPGDVLPLFLVLALIVGGLVRLRSQRPELALWLGLFAVTFVASLPSPFTQWPHHLALAVVFLVMALARILDVVPTKVFSAVAALAALVWLSLAWRLPNAAPLPEASFEKDELLAFVRARGLDRSTLQVHTSWGTYYIAQLFGDPGRAVVYLKSLPDDQELVRTVRTTAEKVGRPLLLVSARRLERIQTPEVTAVLGRPQQTFRFGSWWALVYLGEVSLSSGDGGRDRARSRPRSPQPTPPESRPAPPRGRVQGV